VCKGGVRRSGDQAAEELLDELEPELDEDESDEVDEVDDEPESDEPDVDPASDEPVEPDDDVDDESFVLDGPAAAESLVRLSLR